MYAAVALRIVIFGLLAGLLASTSMAVKRCFLLHSATPLQSAAHNAASFAQPFASTSVWKIELPPATIYKPIKGITNLGVGLSSWLIPDGVSVPLFYATAASPLHTLLYNGDTWSNIAAGYWRTSGNRADVEAQIRASSSSAFPLPYHPYVSQSATAFVLPSSYMPIRNPAGGSAFRFAAPSDIKPSGDADGHMVVFEPNGSAVETYATVVLSDGTVVASTYQVTSLSLAGDGWQNGITASMIPVYAGLLRATDLDAGVINHAMKVAAPPALLAPAYIYPALSFDRSALTEFPPYSGTLPMGARMALPAELDLRTLNLETPVGEIIATAAKRYGFVITDRGGLGITLIAEAGLGSRLRWTPAIQRDLGKIFGAVQHALVPVSAYRTSH